MEPSEQTKAFYMAEYGALRAEVLLSLADVRALERYIAVACAAIWSWAAIHPEAPVELLWIPIILSCLGGLRAWAYSQDFISTHGYICEIEDLLGTSTGPVPGGWEHFPKARRGRITFSAIVFWILLVVAGGIALKKLPRHKEVSKVNVTMSCTPMLNEYRP